MPEPIDLTNVVADATDDAAFDASIEPSLDPVTDAPAADPLVTADATDPLAAPAVDEFEKEWGIPAKSVTGRENRVPHSRVKDMVTKARTKEAERLAKEFETKMGTERAPLETKVKDYEDRLQKVAQFEHVLENDPKTFLGLLSQIPAYKDFFAYIEQLSKAAPATPAASQTPEGMPQPDQTLADGTKVYSMEGLQNLLKWQADNVESRAVAKVRQHYAPIEQRWVEEQRMAQLVPVVEKQIADARAWPHFNELEPTIVQKLKADPQLTLERAYVLSFNEVQVPKVSADRNKMRTDILAELRQKPIASSAPSSAVKPGMSQSAESRSIEEIIAQASKDAGLF